jgi:hypothetical protein
VRAFLVRENIMTDTQRADASKACLTFWLILDSRRAWDAGRRPRARRCFTCTNFSRLSITGSLLRNSSDRSILFYFIY